MPASPSNLLQSSNKVSLEINILPNIEKPPIIHLLTWTMNISFGMPTPPIKDNDMDIIWRRY
jgi:hypothetical protein